MTELLKQAIELSKKEQPIPVSDELVKDWLDSLIDLNEQVLQISKDLKYLNMGELDTKRGEYTHVLTTCEYNICDFKQIQLYKCIYEIARVLNVETETRVVTYSDGSTDYDVSFMYRGYKIHELCH